MSATVPEDPASKVKRLQQEDGSYEKTSTSNEIGPDGNFIPDTDEPSISSSVLPPGYEYPSQKLAVTYAPKVPVLEHWGEENPYAQAEEPKPPRFPPQIPLRAISTDYKAAAEKYNPYQAGPVQADPENPRAFEA